MTIEFDSYNEFLCEAWEEGYHSSGEESAGDGYTLDGDVSENGK